MVLDCSGSMSGYKLEQAKKGVLDFAKDANEKKTARVDIQLLDQMQEKYTWILGLIKKHYKKINK